MAIPQATDKEKQEDEDAKFSHDFHCMMLDVFGLLFRDEDGGIGGDALHASGKAEALGGSGLNAHGVDIDIHEGRKYGLHGRDVGIDLRTLSADGAVDIAHTITTRSDEICGATKQDFAVDALELCSRIGEVITDVAHIGGAEHGVTDGMNEDVGIAMAEESVGVVYLDAAEPEVTAFYEFMDIIAHSDANCHLKGFGVRVEGLRFRVFGGDLGRRCGELLYS